MRIKNKYHKGESGFTIVELLVATTIFSIVLMVILSSFLQIGRMFYKGISVNNVNETARSFVDAVASDVRISGNVTNTRNDNAPGSTKRFFCVGEHRYTFVLNRKVGAGDLRPASNSIQAGLMQDTVSGGACPHPSVSGSGTSPQQLLGPDMQLNRMVFACNTTKCDIQAHVIFYGADNSVFASSIPDLDTPAEALTAPDAFCSGSLLSTQFCATADINTVVTTRL